ncbi:MAG: hypothetical protein ACK5Q5_23235, partial [Planctomycetaceae bacterium]
PGIPRGQGRGLQLSDAVRIERSIAGRAEAKIRPPESPDRLLNVIPDALDGEPRVPGHSRKNRIAADNPNPSIGIERGQGLPGQNRRDDVSSGRPVVTPGRPQADPEETIIRQRGNVAGRDAIPKTDIGNPTPKRDPRGQSAIGGDPSRRTTPSRSPGMTLPDEAGRPNAANRSRGLDNGNHTPDSATSRATEFPFNPQQRTPRTTGRDRIIPSENSPIPDGISPRSRSGLPANNVPPAGPFPRPNPTPTLPGAEIPGSRGRGNSSRMTLPPGGSPLNPSQIPGQPPTVRSGRSSPPPMIDNAKPPAVIKPAPRGRSKESKENSKDKVKSKG